MILRVVVGIPLGFIVGFYLLTRYVNRQFDRRPAVEQPELAKDEAMKHLRHVLQPFI